MRPINRIPKGLLDFFGLKSLGRNPETLLDEVRPTVDLREWYLRTNAEQLRFVQTITAGSVFPASDPHMSVGALVVPSNEWWYVHSCTLILFYQPGAIWYQPGVMTVRNSAPSQYYEALLSTSVVDQNAVAGSSQASWAFSSRPRVWLPPDTIIGASYGFVSAVSMTPGDVVNFNTHLSVTRASA